MSTRLQTSIALAISLGLHGSLALIPVLGDPPAQVARRVLPIQIVDAPAPPEPAPPRPPPEPPAARQRHHHRVRRAIPPDQHLEPAPAPPRFGVDPDQLSEGTAGPRLPPGETLDRPSVPTIKLKAPAFLSAGGGDLGEGGAGKAGGNSRRRFPRVREEHRAPYPAEARDLGVEGTVVVRILVGADGRVHRTKLISGPGFGLNRAARKALGRTLFDPALDEEGRPVQMWITYRYTFVQD